MGKGWWPFPLVFLTQRLMSPEQGGGSHLLHVLLALFHFVLELLLLLWGVGLLCLAVGFPGHRQLLLLAGQVVGFLGCLQLWGGERRDIRAAVTAPRPSLCL